MPNKCTPEFSYGGCWTRFATDRNISACVDGINDYKRLAARGHLDASSDWVRCECPSGCFYGDGADSSHGHACKMKCAWERCVGNPGNYFCLPDDAPAAAAAPSGVSAQSVFWIIVLTVACTVGLGYAAMRLMQQRRKMGEMRNIMGQVRRGPRTGSGRGADCITIPHAMSDQRLCMCERMYSSGVTLGVQSSM